MANNIAKLFSRNTLAAKLKRTVTGVLPVDKNRNGQCNRCGACCKLPYPCPFLSFDEQGLCVCKVYPLRPPNCRKYPRTKSELLTSETCGYSFDEQED